MSYTNSGKTYEELAEDFTDSCFDFTGIDLNPKTNTNLKSNIMVHVLPLNPEHLLNQLECDYIAIKQQIIALVNGPKPHTEQQIYDYVDLRNQQVYIEQQINQLFTLNN